MIKYRALPIDSIGGFSGMLFYCIFTFISIIFSESWDPFNNTLSQLGNSVLNPNSAIFYTLGMIFGGLSLLIFYAGIYKRHIKKFKDKKFASALIFGCINSISVIFSGVFSESIHYELHIIFSVLIFITFIPILYFVGRFLSSNSMYPKIVCYYGYLVTILILLLLGSISLSGFGGSAVPLLESISVFSFIGWVGLLSYNSLFNN
jgi:hypothetical protein